MVVLSVTVSSLASASEECPNEALRIANRSTALPDCRAYEQVSPGHKNGTDVVGAPYTIPLTTAVGGANVQAAPEGGAVVYAANGGFENAQSFGGNGGSGPQFNMYLAAFDSNQWLTTALNPPFQQESAEKLGHALAFSNDLSSAVDVSNVSLVSGAAPNGIDELYLRSRNGAYTLITPPPPADEEEAALGASTKDSYLEYEGGNADLTHLLFSAKAALAEHALQGNINNLYEWANGSVKLASILPDGTAVANAVAGGAGPDYYHDVSDDGSRVIFTAMSDEGSSAGTEQVFVRENGETTIEISASQRSTPDPHGPRPASYVGASVNGSRVFFLSKAELTDGATTGTADNGNNLYEYSLETKELTDLSVDPVLADAAHGSEVQGVLGLSANGAYAYFVAKREVAGQGEENKLNLYVMHEGAISYIGRLQGGDSTDWSKNPVSHTAEITTNGEILVFRSESLPIRGIPFEIVNGEETTFEPSQVLEYESASQQVSCISCSMDGGRPSNEALVPTGTTYYQPQYVSPNGDRVFFDSKEALVPRDTNSQWDVYEWESGGTGSCASETAADGCQYLISSGTSAGSGLADATETGNEVFFATRSQLVPDDEDENVDLYDAVVGGGLPVAPATNTPCSGEACQGGYTGQSIFSPPSSTLDLSGSNLPTPAEPAPEAKKQGKKTKAQKLKAAMKKCKQHNKGAKRRACEKAARKRFGPKTAA